MSRPAGSEDINADPGVIEIYPVFRSSLQRISYVEPKQAPRGSIELNNASNVERKVSPAPSRKTS
jgi:hypothetical protein